MWRTLELTRVRQRNTNIIHKKLPAFYTETEVIIKRQYDIKFILCHKSYPLNINKP